MMHIIKLSSTQYKRFIISLILNTALGSCITKTSPPKQPQIITTVPTITDKVEIDTTKSPEQNLPNSKKQISKLHFVFFPGLGQEHLDYFVDTKKQLKNTYSKLGIEVKFSHMGRIKTKINENCSSIKMPIKQRAKHIAVNEFEEIIKNKEDDEIITVIAHSQGGITFLNCLDYMKRKNDIDLKDKISYAHFAAVPFGGSINSSLLTFFLPLFKFLTYPIYCFIYLPFFVFPERVYKLLTGSKKYLFPIYSHPLSLLKAAYANIINAPVKSLKNSQSKGASNLINNSDAINIASKTFKNIEEIIPDVNLIRAEKDYVVSKHESFGKKLKFPINNINKKIVLKNKGKFWSLQYAHTGCVTNAETWQFITDKINRDHLGLA